MSVARSKKYLDVPVNVAIITAIGLFLPVSKMKLFHPLFRTSTKHRKDLVKELGEIRKQVRMHFNAYMKYQTELTELRSVGWHAQIRAKEVQAKQERRKISELLKQQEKVRSLLAYVH